MSRISGKNGLLYAGIASSGTAEPIAFINQFSLDFKTDKQDVTCFNDTNKVYVSGYADASGSYSGFYDNATAQMYSAATDGIARKFYFYPDRTATSQYWFGTGLFDFSVAEQLGGGVAISGSWAAASAVSKIG